MIPIDRDDDDDKRNRDRRRSPFDDFFGFDDDFERLFEEMQRMMERSFSRHFNQMKPGKPFVHGFSINVGPDGKPRVQEFGNRRERSPSGEPTISEEREPLTDVMAGDEEVSVTVELPGVEKDEIDLKATEDTLEISVDTPQRKYHKTIDLPCDVKPKSTKATYKSGVLDVEIERKEKKKEGEGYKVNIE